MCDSEFCEGADVGLIGPDTVSESLAPC
jgi:hypothetical protein